MATQLPSYREFTPQNGDPDEPVMWADWLEGLEAMLKEMKIRDSKEKHAMLMHYMGTATRKILKKLSLNGIADENYDTSKEALNEYFAPAQNRTYLLYTLQQLKQESGETMDNFYMRVKEKIDLLNLTELSKDEIIDLITAAQLINNTAIPSLWTKALKDSLSLADLLKTARAYEKAEQQSKHIIKSETIHAVKAEKSEKLEKWQGR